MNGAKGIPLDDEMAARATGGFAAGTDSPYTVEQFSSAGVTWEHIPGVSDRYLYRGEVISKACAEVVADFFFKKGRAPTDNEFAMIRSLYRNK